MEVKCQFVRKLHGIKHGVSNDPSLNLGLLNESHYSHPHRLMRGLETEFLCNSLKLEVFSASASGAFGCIDFRLLKLLQVKMVN